MRSKSRLSRAIVMGRGKVERSTFSKKPLGCRYVGNRAPPLQAYDVVGFRMSVGEKLLIVKETTYTPLLSEKPELPL